MSLNPRARLTPEEYLAIERAAEERSEYVNGEMFALSGASFAHTVITANLVASLHVRLRAKPCTVHAADLKVRVEATGLHAYPDVVVVCGEPRFADAGRDVVTNPVLLVEVLSESTEKWDRGAKFGHYRLQRFSETAGGFLPEMYQEDVTELGGSGKPAGLAWSRRSEGA